MDIAKELQNPVGNLTILPLELLKKLDDLGIADATIIDNGPENDTRPDGANTPFRAQKDTNWEGAWRVPAFLRWPRKIKAGSVFNGIGSHFDMFPTLLAAASDPDVTQKLLNGCTVGGKTFKVHLDGYNMIPYVTGAVKESPRNAIMYSATTARSWQFGSATISSISRFNARPG